MVGNGVSRHALLYNIILVLANNSRNMTRYSNKEFNKNKIIIPLLLLITSLAVYLGIQMYGLVRPVTLEEYDARYKGPPSLISDPFSLGDRASK